MATTERLMRTRACTKRAQRCDNLRYENCQHDAYCKWSKSKSGKCMIGDQISPQHTHGSRCTRAPGCRPPADVPPCVTAESEGTLRAAATADTCALATLTVMVACPKVRASQPTPLSLVLVHALTTYMTVLCVSLHTPVHSIFFVQPGYVIGRLR